MLSSPAVCHLGLQVDATSVLDKRPLKVVHPGEKVPDLAGVADVCLRATEEGPKVTESARACSYCSN